MKLQDKKYLVTGGTGFIGSYIVNLLLKKGCNVKCLTFNSEFDWRIDYKNYKIDYINLLDQETLNKYIKALKPDIIFHLAGYVNAERDFNYINKMIDINLKGTMNLLKSLNCIDYDLFINTGTCEEYGYNPVPFFESQKENPVSPYSASKVATTYFCKMIKKIYNKPIVTVRPFLTYGGKQISRMLIPWLIYSGIENKEIKLTDGEQTRDFIYVKDIANGYLSLVKSREEIIGEDIFNLGTGKEIKINDVVKIIKTRFNTNKYIIGAINRREGETSHFFPSIKKIKKYTNWEPRYSLEEGLNETVEWFQQNKIIWEKYKKVWE